MKYHMHPEILDDYQYEIFINKWMDSFSCDIKNSWPNIPETKKVIISGIILALNASLSVMEIYDYFSISYPGIIHKANEVKDEQEKIFSLFVYR